MKYLILTKRGNWWGRRWSGTVIDSVDAHPYTMPEIEQIRANEKSQGFNFDQGNEVVPVNKVAQVIKQRRAKAGV